MTEFWHSLGTWGKIWYVLVPVVLGWTLSDVIKLWRRGNKDWVVIWLTVLILQAWWVMWNS